MNLINKRFKYIDTETVFDIKENINVSIVPSIVIFGAQKSGTTSLANYLDKHPQIYMTKPLKETGYFLPFDMIKNNIINQGVPIISKEDCIINYSLKNYKGEPYILDASTYYTIPPKAKRDAAINIFNRVQKTRKIKFLYIMRNPYLRLFSHYSHLIKRSKYEISFEDFILNQSINPLDVSSYASRILEYKENLNSFEHQILFFEDLIDNPQDTMNKVFDFLNLEKIIFDEFKQFNKGLKKEKEDNLILTEPTKNKIRNLLESEKEKLHKYFPNLSYPQEFMRIPIFFKKK